MTYFLHEILQWVTDTLELPTVPKWGNGITKCKVEEYFRDICGFVLVPCIYVSSSVLDLTPP